MERQPVRNCEKGAGRMHEQKWGFTSRHSLFVDFYFHLHFALLIEEMKKHRVDAQNNNCFLKMELGIVHIGES